MKQRVDWSHRAGCSGKADADLIAEMHLPGSDALGALFQRYIRLVHRVAVRILRDEGEAEDVTQEVFLEIYRKSHLYDPSRGAVRVWLLQYAYHRSLRRKEALRRRAAYRGEPLEGIELPVPGHRHGLTRQECRWIVRTGLAQLTERQRATLELACLEEVSLQDVAQRLRVSLGCARHYYYRGLARLRAWAERTATPAQTGTAGGLKHAGCRPPGPKGPQGLQGPPRPSGPAAHRVPEHRIPGKRTSSRRVERGPRGV
jgi:RNA polymerase sigma-70 factor (ECF subfamily)